MTKLWNLFVNKFFTKKFIIFGIIGIINTVIHNVIYFIATGLITNANYYLWTAISFTIATICSYFMNSYFTFKEEKFNFNGFIKMFIVFTFKLFLTLLIQYGFAELLELIFKTANYERFAAIPAQLIMIPISFLVLDKLFDKKGTKKLII